IINVTVPTLKAGTNTTTAVIGAGGDFSFTANAISSNDSPLTYAWKNGNSLVGTAKTFSSTAEQSTTYTCEVADEYNNKITITYTVTVHTLTASQSAASLSIFKGDAANMSVTASSTAGTVNCKWYVSGNQTEVATGTSYSPNPTATTTYTCVVTDGYNTKTFNFTVTVKTAGLINNTDNSDKVLKKGGSVTLTTDIKSDSELPISYQWQEYKNGGFVDIKGATLSSYNVKGITSDKKYRCVAKDSRQNTEEVTFNVIVPNIIVDNSSYTIKIGYGQEINLSASAECTNSGVDLNYKWMKGNTNLDITGSTYSSTETADSIYYCVVSNEYGYEAKITYSIIVYTLSAQQNSTALQIYSGGEALLSVVQATTNSGNGITYKWYEFGNEGTSIPNNGSSCTVRPTASKRYCCKVSDGYSTLILEFNVNVISSVLKDNTEQKNIIQGYGKSVTLQTDVTCNSGSVKYQWQRLNDNGTYENIANATSSSYTTKVYSSCSFRCMASDNYNNSLNIDFKVTVPTLKKGTNNTTITINQGGSFTLKANVNSSIDSQLHYVWTEGSSSVNLGNGSSYTSKGEKDTTYKCVVTDDYENSVTIEYKITVVTLTVSGNGSTFNIKSGESTTLKVTANTTSSNAITYKWYSTVNGKESLISGAASSSYVAKPSSSTKYRCEVSDTLNTKSVSFNVNVSTPAPTAKPTAAPTAKPTNKPTAAPTAKPTAMPTAAPTVDPKADIRGFVERLYNNVLNRASEPGGIDFWTNELYTYKETGAQVAVGFIGSKEFKDRHTSDSDFIDILYRTFFDREPESSGKAFWMNQLKTGAMTRDQVAMGFIDSQEWADTCARYGIRSGGSFKSKVTIKPSSLTLAFVERMYTTALGRDYDTAGRDFWAKPLANFELTGEQVGINFFNSAEMKGYNLSDSEYIERLYLTFMDRPSDSGGKTFWLNFLKEGHSREELVLGFTRSEEFVNKCIEARILPY
ncbi:MAG: DUF4214 domain-containing protein, partial [Clostridia bacterium]|nr:DUF4214 domain-containing protein [Clostridia bacterium]